MYSVHDHITPMFAHRHVRLGLLLFAYVVIHSVLKTNKKTKKKKQRQTSDSLIIKPADSVCLSIKHAVTWQTPDNANKIVLV